MATQDFSGKVAMVTGGGSGMGRSTALAFAAAGARTVVVDLSEESARATVDLIKEQGGEAIALRCDVTRSEDLKAALEETVATYGRLDVAFNNAGLEHGLIATAEISDAEFDRIVNVSLKGVFLSMKHQIPLMLANGGGAIVNNSSAAGLVGFKGQAAYTAAKHGMVGLTKSAALDYAPENVRINAICPGIVDTPMMDRVTGGTSDGRAAVITMEPIGRMGRPEEISATVLWLCSDAASFVVGHALSVDGGMTTGHFGER
ncbi:SDR family oxidoreductase [Arthrobacter sp. FW305-BF8]|uniref:SDR family oxidoreductase n=1 Tax=Arthrobacter sp. FW305-BF8 TaxID=2879617 RepID=UPI001EFFD47E|nr:SDR family oxidoreductase [Arthrobacter sp. FW305-BF8]UKA55255.1 SDR family oxidoreductase [Arthrobacter sp. FW305-BF8]